MNGVQCYELFGGIALKNHAFFIIFYYCSILQCCITVLLPMIAQYGEVSTGHTERERIVEETLQTLSHKVPHVDHLCWADLAADCGVWRHSVFKAVGEMDEERRVRQGDKRSSMIFL